MSRRTASGLVACLLVLALVGVAWFLPVPFVAMSPGPTIDTLGENGGRPIITVSGHPTYRDSGQLRLVTVAVTAPSQRLSLAQAMAAWFDKTRALYPRDAIYPPAQTAQQSEQESSVQMVSSQDTAVAAALRELGYRTPTQTEVLAVTKGSAADGRLEVRDKILRINGHPITDATDVGGLVQQAGVGGRVVFRVERDGRRRSVLVHPHRSATDASKALVGIIVGEGYDFPFDVSVRLSDDIGGPSAGLMFSLAVYDRLTPGSLTGGADVAGTGTIAADGTVGPIGGIQQKIVAAQAAGATLFFVPPDNCSAALGADVHQGRGTGDIELVKAATMHSARASLEAYAKNRGAVLPSCR